MTTLRRAFISARVPEETLRRLERRAERTGRPKSSLIERYLEEGLRMDEHPGIVFVERAGGRRAALATRPRLSVWQVVDTLKANDGSVPDAAHVLGIPETEVRLAMAYYVDHKDEIDGWIRAEREFAARAEAAWRREQEIAAG